MDPPSATDHGSQEPADSHYRQTRGPITSQVDVSWHSNTIAAGRDAIFNIIGAGDVRQPNASTDTSMRTLANWLSPKNHHKVHKDILEKVTKGTGSWIFEHPKFVDWVSKKTNIMWGTGIPGAGKTCLTSTIVEHLVQIKQATVIYIYCQYNDQLSTAEILACMLKQMVESSEKAARFVSEYLHEKCQRTETEPSKSELLATLRGASGHFVDVFFVVDALDELKDDIRPELINDLMSLERPLFMTSRPISDFPGMKEPDFTIQAPDKDFRAYISTKILSFPKLGRLLGAPAVHQEIITKIQARCGGMFLLATLQVDALASGGNTTDVRSLREALEHLPTSLDDQYDVTLKRIRSQSTREQDLACRAISLVTYATSTLSMDELLEALTVDIERAVVDQEWRTPEETLVGACMGLLTVEKETKTVRLIHYTARDYLRRRKQPSELGEPHTFIANTLAVYLNHTNVDSSAILSSDNLLATKSTYPFLNYACSNLGHHTCEANVNSNGRIPTHVIQLFRNRPRVPLPLTLLGNYIDHVQAIHFAALHRLESLFEDNLDMIDQKSLLGCSPSFYACLGGHFDLTKGILDDFRARLIAGYPTKFGATVLHAASRSGQLDLVNLVMPTIDHQGSISAIRRLFGHMNVDINTRMLDGRTALHLAAEYGYASVVNTILAHVAPAPHNVAEPGTITSLVSIGGYRTVFRQEIKSANVDVNAGDRDGRTSLLVAARNGHELVVRSLLNTAGIRVNAVKEDGLTPLHLAAQNGHNAVTQWLLSSTGIKINPKSDTGWTPLYLAAQNGHEVVTQSLLSSPDIQVNAAENGGWTPLHVAAQYGQEAVTRLLLASAGIDVNSRTNNGWTPLHKAVQNGQESVARLLLRFIDIDVNPKSKNGWTPLHLAAQNGHLAIFQLLLESTDIDVNAESNNGWTPLHKAAQNGHKAVVQRLLHAAGIKVNSKSNDGWTLLHVAAQNGQEAVTHLLLSSTSIEINSKTNNGWTPLHLATQHGHGMVVQLLLDSVGIEVNSQTNDHRTPLHVAAQNRHETVAQLLLKSAGIDVNLKTVDGFKPLHIAAQNGDKAVAQLLLDSTDVEVNSKTNDGWTPLHITASHGHVEVVQLLLSSVAIEINLESNNGWTPLHNAAQNGHEAVAQLLLGSPGIKINPKTIDGETPLHLAAQNGDEAITELLLKSTGIEANPKTNDGWTPLYIGAEEGHEPVVRSLLNSTGLELNPRGEGGWTPLHAAALRGHQLVVQLLLNSHGIEVNAKSKTGWTPLYLAAENGHEGIVQLLLDCPGIELHVSGQIPESPLEIARLKKGRDPVTFFDDLPQFPGRKSLDEPGVH